MQVARIILAHNLSLTKMKIDSSEIFYLLCHREEFGNLTIPRTYK